MQVMCLFPLCLVTYGGVCLNFYFDKMKFTNSSGLMCVLKLHCFKWPVCSVCTCSFHQKHFIICVYDFNSCGFILAYVREKYLLLI